tara:strand:- start:2073 stop:2510 length:438 start_codon:yes stop_codon:yes gene_type:complete
MPIHKRFDIDWYITNDASGKKAVTCFLQKQGLSVKENPNKYGIDLITNGTTNKGRVFSSVPVEVERRQIWDKTFPFPTVHVPERKTKFLKHYMLYAVVNLKFNKVMFCSSDIIKQYKPIEIPNKAVANDEYFYDVPITCWEIHDI